MTRNVLLWSGVGALCVLGVIGALERGIDVMTFAFDGHRKTDLSPLDRRYIEWSAALLDLQPQSKEYRQLATQTAVAGEKYTQYPVITLLHVLPGAALLALAPFQFSSKIRTRHVRLHRWSGRVLLLAAALAGLSGLFFGLLMPYGGTVESLAAAAFGGLLLVAAALAYVSIRRGDVVRHREWMIRMLAAAVGIAVIRLVGGLGIAIGGAQVLNPYAFGISLWIGWLVSLGAAELWIRHTRSSIPQTVNPKERT